MNKYLKWGLTALAILLIIGIMVGMVVFLIKSGTSQGDSPVHSTLTAEAGEEFDFSAFLKKSGLTVERVEGTYDLHIPKDYRLILHLSNGESAKVTLSIRDSKPPKVTEFPPLIVKKNAALLPSVALPEELIEDATEVKITYLGTSINTSTLGLHTVSFRLEDAGGNVVKADVEIFVVEEFNNSYCYEIGSTPPSADEILPGANASFKNAEDLHVTCPSLISATVKAYGGEYTVRFEAVDTTPPAVTVKNSYFSYPIGSQLPEDPMTFIESITDATDVTVEYAEEYLFDRAENKTLEISVTDLGGNCTVARVTVLVYNGTDEKDVVPPIISGAKDLMTQPGVKPDYLAGVTAYDGRDGVIPTERITVDDSAVDLNTISAEGYPIIYTVSDQSGNYTSVTVYLKVVRPSVSEEEMNALFDQILEGLYIDGLSRFSVLSKLHYHIKTEYPLKQGAANSATGDIYEEAYWSFKLKVGNHESYYAMAAVLLEKMDISYYRVNRNAVGSREHCWLLVDYGIGWLYFDCTPIDGYIWTKDGKVYKTDSAEGINVSPANVRNTEAMTDADIAQLTELLNNEKAGWNYYKADTSNGKLPQTAVRNTDGSYSSVKYTVQYKTSIGGKLTGSTTQQICHGTKGTAVTAVPNPGYRFLSWSDGITEATRTDIPYGGMTVTAYFELDNSTLTQYTVKYQAGEHGTVLGNTEQRLLYGKRTTAVTAVPDEGYYFVGWDDGLTTSTRQDDVKGDVTYRAIFAAKICYTYNCTEGGRIEGNDRQTVIPGTPGEYVTAVAGKGYRFVGWSDGVDSETRRDTNIVDVTVTAEFEKIVDELFTVEYLAGEGGSILGTAKQSLLGWSSSEEVTAVAEEGYYFVGWSDGVKTVYRTDLVYWNFTVTALFEKNSYTVNYLAGEGGTLLGGGTINALHGETLGPIEAVAEEGYRFVGWSDGRMDAIRYDTVTEDGHFTALFEKTESVDPEPDQEPDTDSNPDPNPDPVTEPEPATQPEGGNIL